MYLCSIPSDASQSRVPPSTEELQATDRAAWCQLYERSGQAAVWHPLPFLGELIDRIRPVEGLPVVDLACGDGGQISGLPPELPVIGVDQATRALDLARIRLASGGRRHCTLLRAELHALPLPDNSAGGAVLIDILSSFLDPKPVLDEAYRVLAPGAALAVTTFTPRDPLALAAGAVAGKPIWLWGFITIFYDARQVGELLRKSGFDVEHESTRADREGAHPGYREEPHLHDRAVVIGRKRVV
jgi:SAM-dependent methyltransferase